MPQVNVFARLDNEYYQLTGAEKKVADYVVSHEKQTQYMSISELAEECGVAEATISRFCRRMGYKGYSAFKLAVANSTVIPERVSPIPEMDLEEGEISLCQRLYNEDVAAIAQTRKLIRPEEIARAVDLMAEAGKVLCMGQGGSMIMAQEAAHLFSTVRPNFYPICDAHMQAIWTAQLVPEDAVRYFSYSGATRDLVEVLAQAKGRGARCILISRFPKSPGSQYADLVLQCGSKEGPLQLGTVAARMAQLYLLDVLFHEMCQRDPKGAEESRERIADALSEKHL